MRGPKLQAVARGVARGVAIVLVPLFAACQPAFVVLRFQSDASTNSGRPLSVLVRSAEGGAVGFRSERYADIEQLATAPDKTVLRLLTLYPGGAEPRVIDIPYPASGGFAVYALYGEPSGPWKVLYEPTVPRHVDLVLGARGIDPQNSRGELPLFSPRDPPIGKTDGAQSPRLPPPPALKIDTTPPAAPAIKPPAIPGGGA